jgi:hypothetical protein
MLFTKKEKNKMDKSKNWSPILNRNLSSEEIKEDELRYVIDTLYKETKGLKLGFQSEIRDDGLYDLHTTVDSGDDFTLFILTKEEMNFVTKKLIERKRQEETEESKEENVKEENVKEENVKEDLVNHPKHYTSDPSGVECIQITRHRNFNVGNALKYLWRNGLKDGNSSVQDLEKAIWYLKDEIKRLKGEYDK